MENYVRCIRCGTRIPTRPEMSGQVVLCPGCLERVYVTEKNQAPEKPEAPTAAASTSLPMTSVTAGRPLAKSESGAGALPIGLIAGVGGVVALLVIGGLIWAFSSSPQESQSAAGLAMLPPPPPPTPTPQMQPRQPVPGLQIPAPQVAPTGQTEQAKAEPSPAAPDSPAAPGSAIASASQPPTGQRPNSSPPIAPNS